MKLRLPRSDRVWYAILTVLALLALSLLVFGVAYVGAQVAYR